MSDHERVGSGYDIGAAKHELQGRAPKASKEREVQNGQVAPNFIKRMFASTHKR